MAGSPVTVGCTVTLTPGIAGAPATGAITLITQPLVTAGGVPLATSGAMCQMINSVTGAPYLVPIGVLGASTGVKVAGQALVRMGDMIQSGPGMLQIIGPPAAPFVTDGT